MIHATKCIYNLAISHAKYLTLEDKHLKIERKDIGRNRKKRHSDIFRSEGMVIQVTEIKR